GGGRCMRARTRSTPAVDVPNFQAIITDSICHCLHVEAELALVRKGAHLVGFVDADDAGGVGEIAEIGHRAHRTGWNSGSVTSSVSFENTTSTGMSHVIFFGSGSTLTRFESMCGPSDSSIIASTYGVGTLNALLKDW